MSNNMDLDISGVDSFCGGRVIVNFPEDHEFCPLKKGKKVRSYTQACENCENEEDSKGDYWTPGPYCVIAADLPEAVLIAENTVRHGRAGVAFVNLSANQMNSLDVLKKLKYKVHHEFKNPNTGNTVFCLSKLLV